MPLTGKEKRKYLAELKEKKSVGDHIVSDPTGLQLRKGQKDPPAASETPEDDAVATGSSGKGAAGNVIDLAASPPKKKARTGQKDADKSEEDAVAEVDAAYRQSFWNGISNTVGIWRRMFCLLPWMKTPISMLSLATWCKMLAPVPSGLWYIFILWSVKDAIKDVEKYKHKAAAFEERVEGLLSDKVKTEKALSDLEKERAGWLIEKGDLMTKASELEKNLAGTKEVVEDCKMALVSQFEDGFDRAKSQVAFLYPDLDLSALDSLKNVQEGELVDEP